MSASSQKSNSSASRPRATKRQKATPRASAKAPKVSRSSKSTKVAPSSKTRTTRSTGRTNAASSRSAESSLRTSGRESSRVGSSAPLRANAASSSSADPSRFLFIGAIVVGILAIVGIAIILVLSRMPVFVISSIDAAGSDHVTAETVARLASVEEGTTLLSMDVNQISDNVKRNPWVKNVIINREFPDTLSISIEEREVAYVVVIGAGASVWALGEDGVWIEPIHLDTSGVDVATAALEYAKTNNCILITDVSASVDPAQGSKTSDDSILAVMTYQAELPDDIKGQARVYYASSEASVSMVLDSGIEISLGSPEDVNSKSLALNEILATYSGQLTYINVRVPSKPTYRKVPDGTTISTVEDVVASNATTEDATADSADDSSESEDTSSEDSE